MLFYRILLFSYLIDSIAKLIPKLFFIGIYLFLAASVLVGLNDENFSSAVYALKNPRWTFRYLYRYIIWLYYHFSSLSFWQFFNLMISLAIPYLSFLFIKNIALISISKTRIFAYRQIKAFTQKALLGVKTLILKSFKYKNQHDNKKVNFGNMNTQNYIQKTKK